MKIAILPLSVLAAASVMPLAAQTAATPARAAHPATVHHTTTFGGGCVTVPTLSPKIPALPLSAPCAKALYTLTRIPDMKADYISPLVSPEVREILTTAPTTFSLAYIDQTVGTGELVKGAKFVTVKYTGYLTDGTKFDSSEDHPNKEPLTFQYGMHKVIQGWDTGFEGMHIGGKRRIFIPYQLAYGDAGRPPVIPAKSELVFDVEVVSQGDVDTSAAKRMPPPRPVPQAKPATPPADSKPESKAGTPPPVSGSTPPATTAPKQ
jgi:peptidylprolyl isomerase